MEQNKTTQIESKEKISLLTTNESLKNLNPSEREVVILSTSTKIKDKKEESLLGVFEQAISTACIIKGIGTLTKDSIRVMAQYIANYAVKNFKGFTAEEICKAIEKGSLGELKQDSDLNTINIENIINWVKRYDVNIRRPAIHKYNHEVERERKQISENEKAEAEERFNQTIRNYYIEFKNGKPFDELFNAIDYQFGYVAVLYDSLDKKGKINLSIEEKKQIYEIARHTVIKEKTESISKNFFTGGNFDLEVKNKAKYLGLKKQFEKWRAK